MKNLLRKLSGADKNDRREALEHEAAERIKEVGGQPPAEAHASSWASAPMSAPDEATPSTPESLSPSAGRRLTVQERVAARELQNR